MKEKTSNLIRNSDLRDVTINVRDFINLIRIWEEIFKNPLTKNSNMVTFLKDMRHILDGCKELEKEQFLKMLENSISQYKENSIVETIQLPNDIERMEFDEIKILLSKDLLSKEQLLILGEKRFGIPSGTHKRTKKEDVKRIIGNAIDNAEILNIIEKKASE
jgi:hypothetical protein